MKKSIRILLFVLSILIICLLGMVYYSVSQIDTRPYFQTSYYQNTIEKINNRIDESGAVNGQLLAGYAKVNITPIIDTSNQDINEGRFNRIKLSGYSDGKYATGIHDSLYAKAVALDIEGEIQVLVSSDLLLMPPAVVEAVDSNLRTRSEIVREQIIFGATHTHASIGNFVPGYVGKEFCGEFQPEVVEWLGNKFTDVILFAVEDLKKASIGSNFAHIPELIANRLIGESGRLHDRFTILSIKQNLGKHAVIGIYGAHATVLGPWNDKFSGGYPGYFQSSLEEKGIDIALFFAGTVGSHRNRGKGEKFERARYIGENLADSAFSLLKNIKYSDKVKFLNISTDIEIPELQAVYLSEQLRLSPEMGANLFPEFNKTYIQSFRLNNFIWLSMPCELSGEYAIDLQNALHLEGFNSGITSFNGQYLGYVIPAKYYNFDSYESRQMGWFGPSMGDYLMELNYKIAGQLVGERL